MGLLYGDKLNDPVAAMYHFSRFLKLSPDSPNASAVQAHLNNAQIQFAVTLPNSPVQNAEAFAKLQSDNQELARARDEALRRVAELEAKFSEPPALAQSSSPNSTAVTSLPLEPVAPIAPVTPTRVPRAPTVEIPSLAPELTGGKPVRTEVLPEKAPEKTPKTRLPVAEVAQVPATPVPPVPTPAPAAPVNRGTAHTYTVQKGDSLWKISSKFYPGQVKEGIEKLRSANPGTLAEGKLLKPGQVLNVP
jgi:nucleoid-associated protein YgaU